jgi:hypothetical protein
MKARKKDAESVVIDQDQLFPSISLVRLWKQVQSSLPAFSQMSTAIAITFGLVLFV